VTLLVIKAEIFKLKMKIQKKYQKMKVQMMERRVTDCSELAGML
jgi:hypothetical protein